MITQSARSHSDIVALDWNYLAAGIESPVIMAVIPNSLPARRDRAAKPHKSVPIRRVAASRSMSDPVHPIAGSSCYWHGDQSPTHLVSQFDEYCQIEESAGGLSELAAPGLTPFSFIAARRPLPRVEPF
jgi:hypothetical protein